MAGATVSQFDVEQRIMRILESVHQTDVAGFKCDRVILYYYDQLTGLLEPHFMVPQVDYSNRRPVPSSVEFGAYVANWAFEKNEVVFSLDPQNDDRWTDLARELMWAYQIVGGVIGCPLLSETPEKQKLGALVVCAKDTLQPPDPHHLVDKTLNDALVRLSFLLATREIALALKATYDHESLTQAILAQLRPIATPDRVLSQFTEQCRNYLRADSVLLDISYFRSGGDLQPRMLSSFNQFGEERASGLRNGFCATPTLVLNRRGQQEDLYDQLSESTGCSGHVWAAHSLKDSEMKTCCVVGRLPKSISDHWTEHDITFLNRSLSLLHIVLTRSFAFQVLLDQLGSSRSEVCDERVPFPRSRFDFITHICREFLNVDQILLTCVVREATAYSIQGVFADGFGDRNNWLVEATDRKLAKRDLATNRQLDVMPHILRQYLRAVEDDSAGSLDILTSHFIGEPSDLIINREVIEECHVNGNVYFLSCISGDDERGSELRSILHLGRSDGTLKLGDAEMPLLRNLADSIAAELAEQERLNNERILRNIRSCDHLDIDRLRTVAQGIQEICRSVGATVFIRASLLYLCGWNRLPEEKLVVAFERFLACGKDRWQTLRDDDRDRITRMFCSFLGVERSEFSRLLAKQCSCDIAPLMASALYVCAARSETRVRPERFSNVVESAADCSGEQFVSCFADFLIRDCYLPGYGLTGWVLRYRIGMLLASKTDQCIREYFDAHSSSISRPWVSPIVRTLENCHIKTSLSERPLVPPTYADHLRDRKDVTDVNDTYLAHPLEDIDDPHFPGGVVRTSTSAVLRASFDETDSEAIERISAHLSSVLRRTLLRQRQFVAEHSEVEKLRDWLYHRQSRLANKVSFLHERMQEQIDTDAEVCTAFSELDAALLQVNRSRAHGKLIREVSARTSTEVRAEDLAAYTRQIVQSSGPRVPVTVDVTADSDRVASRQLGQSVREGLIALCLSVDELVINSIRHGPQVTSRIAVLIEIRGRLLTIQVVEQDCDEQPDQLLNLTIPEPYSDLLLKRNQGSRFFRQIVEELGAVIQFEAVHDPLRVYQIVLSETGDPHDDESPAC